MDPFFEIHTELISLWIFPLSFFKILEADDEIEQSGALKPQIQGKFSLKSVDFLYPNGHHALKQVNMEIRPNKITALVGLSGAGKSTLISLLDKFYQPDTGKIELDGMREVHVDICKQNSGGGVPYLRWISAWSIDTKLKINAKTPGNSPKFITT